MTKKKKAHKAQAVRVPITDGFVNELGQEMHFALLGMSTGNHGITNWSRAGKVLLVLSMASDDNPNVVRQDKVEVDAAVIALDQISCRARSTDNWTPTPEELNCLRRGALAAEAMLPWLDSRDIQKAQAYVALLEVT